MKAYHALVQRILDNGVRVPNRTGIDTISVLGEVFEHDMADGFPLMTSKKMPFRSVGAELEFFIRGYTDKRWLQERKCTIWNEWQSPESDLKHDLGPLYGFQWRHFGAAYPGPIGIDTTGELIGGVDQLKNVIELLKRDPNSRRAVVSAWNPMDLPAMALEPCHVLYQFRVLDGKLSMVWFQRSIDTMLGLPFNIASYALLLHLVAKSTGYAEGKLKGFLGDTHIYVNHLEGAKEQLSRDPDKYPLPKLVTEPFNDVFNWEHTHSKLVGYESYPAIKMEVAV
jgi:thymidylate synthase